MTKLKCVLCWPCLYSLLTIIAFGVGAADATFGQEKPAEPAVEALNNTVLSKLPFNKQDDFQDAAHGFIATLPDALVTGPNGHVVWSQKDYSFLEKAAPDTFNPSLWRQAQLNHQHGLFKVVEGVYQVRGIDLSNITILEGDMGLIVVDTLLSVETAKAALDLYYQLLFASGFTTSRAQSTNSFATGLRSRFFSVTRPIGLRVSGKSMGSAFSDPR